MTIDLTPVLQALAALMCAIITAVVIPFIRGKVCAQRLERMQTWARIAVTAAEQLYPRSGRGRDKKTYVLGLLEQRGFELDVETLNALVEAAVNTMNCAKSMNKEEV